MVALVNFTGNIIGAFILRIRVKRFCSYLRRLGIKSAIRGQFRSRAKAHRWSTAYHILSGAITIGDLRALRGGVDRDGNQWYKAEWDLGMPENASANLSSEISANAQSLGAKKLSFAAEGYGPTDARRIPNLNEVPVSKHIWGLAIDVNIDWDKLGAPWSNKVCDLVDQWGLARPVISEHWHLELKE